LSLLLLSLLLLSQLPLSLPPSLLLPKRLPRSLSAPGPTEEGTGRGRVSCARR